MIESTPAYKAAITGDSRRMLIQAAISIISPDIVYGGASGSNLTPYSKTEQLYDKVLTVSERYTSLEYNRWILDGSTDTPADELSGEIGAESAALSGVDGTFAEPQWIELRFSGVNILQQCSVYFTDDAHNGRPLDFSVQIMQGGTAYHTETFKDNELQSVVVKGFTVYSPDAIRVTVTRWSLPYHHMRTVEILPGIFEQWDGNVIGALSVQQQGSFSALTLPYGTCTLSMDNISRRFEPRRKDGVFQSIEERQGIDIYLGAELEGTEPEYKKLGSYYQFSGGWKTGDNGLTMQWNLVDIVGLLVDRLFEAPEVLPTTLGGWVSLLVSFLGPNFAKRYHVDPDYASLNVTADKAKVDGQKCGQILLWICQATHTWPRADAATGDLTVEPLWSAGNTLTLDNMEQYPIMRANDDLASISFTLSDGTALTVPGTSTAAPQSASIANPFLHSRSDALACARWILQFYGGNRLETSGRGDPSSEIGDIDVVWLDENTATNGRRMSQGFTFTGGVLKSCPSVLLQADGVFEYENREVLTASGTWQAPAGVSKLVVMLVGGGQGGQNGQDGQGVNISGFRGQDGANGADGVPGKVWYGTININEAQTFQVVIGGGTDAAPYGQLPPKGGDTSFGAYTSAAGRVYSDGYSDIRDGAVFGAQSRYPPTNSGYGALGGTGGKAGTAHFEWVRESVWDPDGNPTGWDVGPVIIDSEPTPGQTAQRGADGCVVIYWDKPSES